VISCSKRQWRYRKMAFGITSAGFSRPRLADIKTEIESTLRSTFGATINLAPETVWGQIVGVFSEREDLVWQGMEDVYNSQYPDTSFGVSLDNVGALSGIPRKGAIASKALALRLFGIIGTVVPAGSQFSVVDSPSTIFTTDASVTLVAGLNTIQKITFSGVPTAGDWKLSWYGTDTSLLAFNANAAAVQAAIQALPFGEGALVTGNYTLGFTVDFTGSSGLQSWPAIVVASDTLVDGFTPVDIAVTILQAGEEQGTVNCTCSVTGPVIANAGTLTEIVTPVAGLDSVINVTDATIGRDVETDNEYRARRGTTLQVAGAGTPEAIRSRLLAMDGVTAALVFENDDEIPDLAGRPPHSFEAVVQGGIEQDIIDLLWQIKPAGISTFGSVSGTALDSVGQPHTINFSRPTAVPIYVKLTITTNPDFPANGAGTAQDNIVSTGNALGIGKEVVPIPYLIAAIAGIPGIEDAELLIGIAPSPTLSDNIPIAANEVAEFDTVRVDVITI
jgi:uncharacterized phage protein gp47/JayE